MFQLGIIEGFFGPQWSRRARESYASFLSQHGGDFYIYAPKQDPHLRKKWREDWSQDYLAELEHLKNIFHRFQIKFGVGLSPFGLGAHVSDEDKKLLSSKLNVLSDLGIDLLGLFFDDMPTNENLASTQIEALNFIQRSFKGKIIFCPSYYTPDPILDKVFGPRPQNYIEEIGEGIASEVSIAWTGPKVISPELPSEHLLETGRLLKRHPFLWENVFANDGPKNCKFLKLNYYSGRSKDIVPLMEGMGLNLMNQAELSKILFLSAKMVLLDGLSPQDAFEFALDNLTSLELKKFIITNRELFLNQGLDSISDDQKQQLLLEVSSFKDFAAEEIMDWLEGKYLVGSECLTD